MTDLDFQGTSMELEPAANRTLFRTDDPVEVLEVAGRVATALKGALTAGGMVQRIKGHDHVRIDGWQTLGAMLGVSAYVVWSRPTPEDGGGWEARAEARTVDGRVVGAAEAMCTHAERNWEHSDEYAVRSMAQTRAMSKALRGPLGFVITLAGHDATPAEEADGTTAAPTAPAWAEPFQNVGEVAAWLVDILNAAGVDDADKRTSEIGQQILNECDREVPRCVATTVAHVHRIVTAAATPAGSEAAT